MKAAQRFSLLLHIWCLLLLMVCTIPGHAQDSVSSTKRRFDQHALDSYRSQQAFRYETDTPPEQMGIWQWIKYKLGEMLSKFFGTKGGSRVMDFVLYGFMIFAIVAIVLNLAGIDLRRFLVSDARVVSMPYVSEENIRELNIDELIAEAVARGEWRLAVRYQYLKALRLMADRELIHWRAGKTNMDYYNELRGDHMRKAFLTATDDFENVWYGNSEVTEQHYHDSKTDLGRFYTLIQDQKSI